MKTTAASPTASLCHHAPTLIVVLSRFSLILRIGWLAVIGLGGWSVAAEGPVPSAPLNPRYSGAPVVRTWLADDYGAHPENHCVLQHPRTGLIYVGNTSGLLEFDGVRWRLITAPGEGAVLSLCVDRRGRIWFAAASAIFRLEPDARGELRARSMSEQVPAEFRAARNLPEVVASSRGVYSLQTKNLMFFPDDDGPAQVWPVAKGTAVLLALWLIDDEPYVTVGAPANVILRRRGEKFEPTNLNRSVLASRAEPEGAWQLLTTNSFQRWNGTELVATPYPSTSGSTRQAIFLADGRSIIAAPNDGLLVCDRAGRVLQKIDRALGLPANRVTGLAEDRTGGVWVTFPYGIARVQLDTPYARHGPAQGLDGTVNSVTRFGTELFAGGTEVVARRGADGRFRAVDGIVGAQRALVGQGEWLFALGGKFSGWQPAQTNRGVELENRNYYGLVPLTGAPGWYAHGSNVGLRWAHFAADQWISEGPLPAIPGRADVLLEAPANIVWVSAVNLWRVDFRAGPRADAPAQRFRAAEGLPQTPTTLFRWEGEIVALAGGKLMRFDETAGRFAPEARIAGLDNFPIEAAHRSSDGTLWVQGGPEVGREIRHVVSESENPSPRAEKVARFRAEALPGEPLRHLQPTTLFHDVATQTLWIGGHGALISRDLTWQPTRPTALPLAVVRRIETDQGQLIATGDVAAAPAPLPALEPEQDALHIAFSAVTFASDHNGIVRTEYRTRLDGLDREWSAWSRESERRFDNLPWRAFTFHVQARDRLGRVGPETTVAFSIRPPWWATGWARAGYGALGLLGLAGIVRLRTHELHRQAEKLEAVIAHRTHELAESNAQLAAQNNELARLHRLELDGKMSALQAEEKTRLEMLRYQLNPHFLYNSLNSIYGLMFENVKDAGTMVLRLSDFFRGTLTAPAEELPALAAEIDALRPYLDIEQVRWADKLQIEIAVDAAVEQRRVPSFLLLPLVENAIKHGSRTTTHVLRLALRAHAERPAERASDDGEPWLVIEVANTGRWVPPDPPHPTGTGIGLENLRQRLARYYPGQHEFSSESKEGWVTMRLRLGRLLDPDQRPAPEVRTHDP